jgi:hypothetical protein
MAEQRQLALMLKAWAVITGDRPAVGCSHQGVALMVRYASRRPARREGGCPTGAADTDRPGGDHLDLRAS